MFATSFLFVARLLFLVCLLLVRVVLLASCLAALRSAARLTVAFVAWLLLTVGLDIDGSRVVWLLGVVNSSLLSVAGCGVSGLLDVVVGILWFASAVVALFLLAVSSLLVSCRLLASTTATVVAVGLALASRSIVVGCSAQSFGQCRFRRRLRR